MRIFICYYVSMTKLIPLENNVIVAPIEEEATTVSGFILPDAENKKPSRWTVLAVGPWKSLGEGKRAEMDVKEGDVVHFTTYAPNEVKVGIGDKEKTYLIIEQSAILAIEK